MEKPRGLSAATLHIIGPDYRSECSRSDGSECAGDCDIANLKDEMNAKLHTKADDVTWKEVDDDFDAATKTGRDAESLSQPSADVASQR